MAIGNEITALQQAQAEIEKLRGQLQGANTDLLAISKVARESQGNFANIKLPKELESSLSANKQMMSQLNANIKERERLEKALQTQIAKRAEAESRVNKEIIKHRTETSLINKALKDESILTSKLVGAYQKLSVRHKQSAKTLKDLVVQYGKLHPATIKAQKDFDRLDNKIKEADHSARQFNRNVGNYPNNIGRAVSSLRKLAGALGVTVGLSLLVDYTKESMRLAREAKGVEFAFERLGTEGVRAFTKIKKSTRGLLSDLDVKTALVDFNNFNISLEETDKLFEFLAVRSAQTGKSIDSLRDSLVEGLSKESKLRIDNLGISAEKLNEELAKTPDFVKAVANIARREVAEAGDILDKAANSGEALSAALNDVSVNIGKTVNQAPGLGVLARGINAVTEQNLAAKIARDRGNVSVSDGRIFLNQFTQAGREENRRIIKENELRKENIRLLEQQEKQYIKTYGTAGPITQYQSLGGSSGDGQGNFMDYEKNKRLLADINVELDKYNNKISEGQFSTRKEAEVIQNKIAKLIKEREAILGVADARNSGRVILEGTIAGYEKLIEKENDFIRYKAKTTEEIKKATKAIEGYEESIKKLMTGIEDLEKVSLSNILQSVDLNTESSKIDNIDITEGLNYEADIANKRAAEAEKVKIAKLSAEEQQEIFDQLFSTFSNYYGLDLNLFSNLIGGKEVALEDYANFAKSVTNAIFESQMIKYENEIVANQERLDAILNDENASKEKKAQAKIEAEKKEKEIRTKQAKAERRNTLIQIGIDTASAIVKTLAVAGFPAGVPLSIAVGALGAAQAAFVASQPLPQFYKGTENAPEGLALTDEKGAEIHTDKYGNIKDFGSNKGARMKYLEKGDKILTADRTASILASHQEMEQDKIDMALIRMTYDMHSDLEDKIESGIEKGFKKAKIVNNNRIVNQVKTKGFFA